MASALAKPALEVKVPTKLELAKEEFFNQPDGFPFEKFRIEDVALPPDEERAALQVDDEEEVAQDVAASQETGFGSSIGAPCTRPFTLAVGSASLGVTCSRVLQRWAACQRRQRTS